MGNPNLSVVHTFIDELWRFGVRHVVISPGSRSTPVTMSVASHGGFQVHTLLDERSGGFFALGLARRLGQPVLMVCTSGTATANYHPAVMEALQSQVPLIVLTADRPPELHHVGANQTVVQSELFGRHVKWTIQMPVPEDADTFHRQAAATAWRAGTVALSAPMGPVHINWPFREPLVPEFRSTPFEAGRCAPGGLAHLSLPTSVSDGVSLEPIVDLLKTATKPLIVVGPQEQEGLRKSVLKLARAIGAPVLADPLSQLRTGVDTMDAPSIVDRYDWFLDASFREVAKPDLLIRFGRTPTSKGLSQYIASHSDVPQVVVSPSQEWMDVSYTATHVVIAEASCVAEKFAEAAVRLDDENSAHTMWALLWQRYNETAANISERLANLGEDAEIEDGSPFDDENKPEDVLHSGLPFEGRLWLELGKALKAIKNVFVGNSMPVRDMDGFFKATPEEVRIYANRGVSGIDGIVSSAAGTAAAFRESTVLVIGDVSFYHDLNGLLAIAAEKLPLCVILVHNDGGGIFTGLPQSEVPETFGYFQTPHGLDFRAAVEMYGGHFSSVRDWESFGKAVNHAVLQPGLEVIELRTSATDSTELRRLIRRHVQEAIKKV